MQTRDKRLLVISHTPHYRIGAQIVGWGPTVREIDQLSRLFGRIHHIAFVHTELAPSSSLPYTSGKVRLIPVQPSGGSRFRDKLAILWRMPSYAWTILHELRGADVVHVRCPSNISLLA